MKKRFKDSRGGLLSFPSGPLKRIAEKLPFELPLGTNTLLVVAAGVETVVFKGLKTTVFVSQYLALHFRCCKSVPLRGIDCRRPTGVSFPERR